MARRVGWSYVIFAVMVSAVYLLVPAAALPAFAAMVLSTVTVILHAVRRHRPRRRLPWWLLAGGMISFAVGTVVAVVLADGLHDGSFPSAADAVSLGVTFPALLLSLLGLSRTGLAARDLAGVIDALIVTVGGGFLAWVYLIDPHLANPGLTGLQKAVSVAYPLCDVLLLAILLRLALGARRSWSVLLLLVSGGALLAADVMFGLSRLNGDWSMGGPMDAGWIIFFVAAGLAAVHPSMAELTEPRVVSRPSELRTGRILLGVASLVAPTVLFFEARSGSVRDGTVIAAASAVLMLLSLARMSVIAAGLRHTVARERELRRACETLLSATDVARVEWVVRSAVAALLPSGVAHRTLLIVHDDRAGDGTADAVRMRYTGDLDPATAAAVGDFDLVLHCPLVIGGGRVGELYVAADETALVRLQEAVRVLAGQAASMIGHIALNREIVRRDNEAYFRTLVLNAADVILIVGADDRIDYASPSAEQLFGTAAVVGARLGDLVEPAANGSAPAEHALHVAHRADGTLAEVEVTVRDLSDEPTVAGRVLTLRDVTERRRLERELLDVAYLDPLTGLGNRLRFQHTVQAAIAAARAAGRTAGVLLVNIDDFRMVNDTMGHDIGDEVLVAAGRRLSVTSAAHGAVARLGADEFGIVVASASGVAEVECLAERVIAAFAEPFVADGSAVTVQPRIGVATTADARDLHEMLSQADVALGTAKRTTARWRRYEASMHARVLRKMQLRTDLADAIARDEFVLHYQPIVELGTGRTRGLEALVRWQHPTRGMVPPLEFIEIAEESGLIVPLGDWVMRHAIEAAASLREEFATDPPYMSVNVSVRQFRAPGFVDRVLAQLARCGLPNDLLTIEITESLLLGDDEQINADLAALRAAGVRVSIDDFGTGYSSLSYLHRVDVDTLKLDKSFVDTIAASAQQYDLVRGIIQLAHTLQLDVVAEGIETEQHRALLADAGCAYGQGYLFSRPVPQPQVSRWLMDHATGVMRIEPAA
jgi:diguanylate cyclase (GGDEF)-like protein/PAS domain S-box-containing protein